MVAGAQSAARARQPGRPCRRPPASLLPQADAWYDSSRVAHGTDGTAAAGRRRDASYLERTLAQTLRLLDALPPGAGRRALFLPPGRRCTN
jgi:hypothetical protein